MLLFANFPISEIIIINWHICGLETLMYNEDYRQANELVNEN